MTTASTRIRAASTACLALATLFVAAAPARARQPAAASPLEEAVVREAEATVKAFNAADAAALGALFLDSGALVDESPEGRTAITFRWSDDGNFLLGDYEITGPDGSASRSTQRIGWDPVTGRLRSWTFDSDGGFSVGEWNAVEEGWAVQSEATMPDGTTGSAIMTIALKDADHFVIRATDRIVGGVEEPDFEATITRRPPAPGVKK